MLHGPSIVSPLIYHLSNIWSREQISKLLIMQYAPSSCNSCLTGRSIPLQTPHVSLLLRWGSQRQTTGVEHRTSVSVLCAYSAYGSVEQTLHTYLTSAQKEGKWIASSSEMFIFQFQVDGTLGGPENNPGKQESPFPLTAAKPACSWQLNWLTE